MSLLCLPRRARPTLPTSLAAGALMLTGLLTASAVRSQPADELVITPQARKGTAPGAAAAAGRSTRPGASPRGSKLVVVLVADQLRADTLVRYRGLLGAGGLLRLARGATAVGHYGQQNTYTGPGHALIASGAYGYLNGVTQNKWFSLRTGFSDGNWQMSEPS